MKEMLRMVKESKLKESLKKRLIEKIMNDEMDKEGLKVVLGEEEPSVVGGAKRGRKGRGKKQ